MGVRTGSTGWGRMLELETDWVSRKDVRWCQMDSPEQIVQWVKEMLISRLVILHVNDRKELICQADVSVRSWSGFYIR